jgi:hypothetical protein
LTNRKRENHGQEVISRKLNNLVRTATELWRNREEMANLDPEKLHMQCLLKADSSYLQIVFAPLTHLMKLDAIYL